MWQWLQSIALVVLAATVACLWKQHAKLKKDHNRVTMYVDELKKDHDRVSMYVNELKKDHDSLSMYVTEYSPWLAEMWNSRRRLRNVMLPADPEA